MRASRTETAAAALLAALLGAAGPAASQVGPPISLVPAPAERLPAAAAPSGSAADQDTLPDAIQAQALAPADASWSGTLGEEQGAFPQTMWRGVNRSFIAAALPLLAPSASPVLQDLARRLLLSNAASPAGADAANRPGLATIRLERLLALGDVAGALPMMDELPPDPSGDGLDRARVELRFAAGDAAGACRTIEDRIARYQNLWWDRALIACQALSGDGAKAALGLSLLKEQKASPDAAFDTLIDALQGRPRKIDKLPDPTPMRVALLAATKQPLPPDALESAGPAALLAYATSESVPVERRLPAAERAALLGALAPDALGALYQQIDAKPDEQTAALKDGRPPQDAKSRAILYAVARSVAPAATRQAAVAALLDEAKSRGAFALTARLVGPALAELQPENASPDFAGTAARALLVSGQDDAARPWIAAAGGKELLVLSSLGAPAAGEADDTAALLHDGIAALASRDSAAAPAQADLLITLLAAFDEPLGTLDWAPLLAPPHQAKLPSAALWIDQKQAMDGKRVGETVLMTVLLAQTGGRLTPEPILLGRAIAGLRAIGREPDARALALEAAVDAGI